MSTNNNLIPSILEQYINSEIIVQYDAFDKAHQRDHVLKVIKETLFLSQYYPVNKSMLFVIAAYHDLGLSQGREFHHIESGRILLSDAYIAKWFSKDELHTMKEAIEDHRASNKHAPRSIYGKIVAEADRIIDPGVTLKRTVQYGLSHHPELDIEGQYQRFNAHLEDKYAEGGYLKLWIKESSNAARLTELRELISNKVKLREVFEAIYMKEVNS